MRTSLIVLGVCIALGFAFTYALDFQNRPRSASVQSIKSEQDFKDAPDVAMTTLGGEEIKLAAYKGKLVLLNFWATWCAPCKVEFPQMIKLAAEDDDIVFIAISVDDTSAPIRGFISKLDKTNMASNDVVIVHDADKEIAHDVFQVLKYPETIIIAPSGRMTDKIIGAADWLSPEILERLEKQKAL